MKSKLFIILILCFFLNGCWLFEGYYGPFKVKVVTQDGGQIEDVFLTLVSISPGGFIQGTTHSYKETLIVKSGVIIEFPRGFVQRVGDHRATLALSSLQDIHIMSNIRLNTCLFQITRRGLLSW